MEMIKKFYLIIIVVSLASCAALEKDSNFNKLRSLYLNQNEKPIKYFTRDILSHINNPLIEVQTNGLVRQVLMLPLSIRNGYLNYSSGANQGLTLKGSIVTKTQNFGTNMISLMINEQNQLFKKTPIENWKSNYSKEYIFLMGNYQNREIKVSCIINTPTKEEIEIVQIKYEVFKVQEFCKNEKVSLTNIYWVDSNGYIWRSKQWISPDNIYATINIINPYNETH